MKSIRDQLLEIRHEFVSEGQEVTEVINQEQRVIKQKRDRIRCSICNVKVSVKNLRRHVKKVHKSFALPVEKNKPSNKNKLVKTLMCNEVGALCVKPKKITTDDVIKSKFMSQGQSGKLSPVSNVRLNSGAKSSSKTSLSKDEARLIRQSLCEITIANEQIRRYLKKNPLDNEIGKFGVPQDKYRYKFYGHASMVRDEWSRV